MTATGANSFLATWKEIPANSVNGFLRGYRISYTEYNSNRWKTVELQGASQRYTTVTGLTASTAYKVQLVGFTGAGESPPAMTFAVTPEGGKYRYLNDCFVQSSLSFACTFFVS